MGTGELGHGDTPGAPWVGGTPPHPGGRKAAVLLERRVTKPVVPEGWAPRLFPAVGRSGACRWPQASTRGETELLNHKG